MTSRAVIVVLVWMFGCAPSIAPRAEVPVEARVRTPYYQHSFVPSAELPAPTRGLPAARLARARAACRKGDRFACHLAISAAREADAESEDFEAIERAGCRAGDPESCAMIAVSLEPALLGNAVLRCGRERCDLDAVRRECRAGYVPSCRYLGHHGDTGAARRSLALAIRGCEHGALDLCTFIYDDYAQVASIEQQFRAMLHVCLGAGFCEAIAQQYLWLHDAREAGYYLELECQTFGECRTTLLAYRERGVPELYPGRAFDIARYLCAQHRDCNEPYFLEHERRLFEAPPGQPTRSRAIVRTGTSTLARSSPSTGMLGVSAWASDRDLETSIADAGPNLGWRFPSRSRDVRRSSNRPRAGQLAVRARRASSRTSLAGSSVQPGKWHVRTLVRDL